jgi:hypothetical protein
LVPLVELLKAHPNAHTTHEYPFLNRLDCLCAAYNDYRAAVATAQGDTV